MAYKLSYLDGRDKTFAVIATASTILNFASLTNNIYIDKNLARRDLLDRLPIVRHDESSPAFTLSHDNATTSL